MELINVVGGGLAGSMVARALTQEGFRVRVFDDRSLWAGSPYSENLFAEEWGGKLGKVVEDGLVALKKRTNLQSKLLSAKSGQRRLHWLPVPEALWPAEARRVVGLKEEGVVLEDGEESAGRTVVATGVWGRQLVPTMPPVLSLTGHGLLFPSQPIQESISFWAPYRHLKVMRWHDGRIWWGESTTILHSNYKPEVLVSESLQRAKEYGLRGAPEVVFGRRPWVKGYVPYLNYLLEDRVAVLNGGWKLGMVLYAAAAEEIVKHFKGVL